MPLSTVVGREHYVFGSYVRSSVNAYFVWGDFSSVTGRISM